MELSNATVFSSSFFHDSVEGTGEKGQNSCNIDPKLVKACEAERLTPQTSNLKVRGHASPVALFPYKCVPATYCLGVTLRWTSTPSSGGWGGVAILLCMLHANDTGISSGVWAFGSCAPFQLRGKLDPRSA